MAFARRRANSNFVTPEMCGRSQPRFIAALEFSDEKYLPKVLSAELIARIIFCERIGLAEVFAAPGISICEVKAAFK
jgi:hypothetical protein